MTPIKRIGLLIIVFLASFLSLPVAGATIREIERLPFEEAYRQWLAEKEALLKGQRSDAFVLLWGSTDPVTGQFTPTSFFALTCRLGRDAHVHEAFLLRELSTNDWVSMILDASSRLCTRYGVESKSPVVLDPSRGYLERPRSGVMFGPDTRRRVWLEAMAKSSSQP